MKILIYSALFSTLFFAACSNTAQKQTEQAKDSLAVVKPETNTPEVASPIKEILSAYLELKDALSKDDDKGAAAAGKKLETAIVTFDKTPLTPDKAKIYTDIAESSKEHAEHIGKNVGNIKHQREHFESLSQDMYDLVKAFGAGQKLYVDHCPMYNKEKGANWLSATKEISNPYLGQSMLTCGTVKEELN